MAEPVSALDDPGGDLIVPLSVSVEFTDPNPRSPDSSSFSSPDREFWYELYMSAVFCGLYGYDRKDKRAGGKKKKAEEEERKGEKMRGKKEGFDSESYLDRRRRGDG